MFNEEVSSKFEKGIFTSDSSRGCICIVAVDVLGPFPLSSKGSRYIVVFSDYLTRWVDAFPVPSVEATVIAHLLIDEIISRHGAPRVSLPDRGTNFSSKVVAEVCKIFQIQKVNTSSYHPQTDGPCRKV